ncbi:phage tail protein [Lactobacillus paragasseri]|uniref:Phage tail protein n=1 Tax=Lactobacillus paragasseri TaxID=2107999 RepID=A0ABD4ZZ34_9LACO|nr:phage tail protein [Lactobacillus paragasseri]MDK7952151.1 phage tail protein [Lactobacillus paragasseri]MDO6360805.1 phage tail protein [Lactobacillus paragasseri]
MRKITLNGKTYKLELTLDNLRDFGFVPNKFGENTELLSNIVAGLNLGDAFTLIDTLSKLLKRYKVKERDVEQAVIHDKNNGNLYKVLIDFFKTEPLTKQMMKTINPMITEAFNKIKKPMEQMAPQK